MQNTFMIKQNDLYPYLRATFLQADGSPVDLKDATVKFVMQKKKETIPKVNADAVIVNAAEGAVEYRWAEGDTDTPGTYYAEFKVIMAGIRFTVPSDGFIVVHVKQGLSNQENTVVS